MEEYGRIWYNVVKTYTSADLRSDQREESFIGKSCACPAGKHVRRTWYNVGRYDTSAGSPSDEGGHLPWRTVCIRRGQHVGTTWYNVGRHDTVTIPSKRFTHRQESASL